MYRYYYNVHFSLHDNRQCVLLMHLQFVYDGGYMTSEIPVLLCTENNMTGVTCEVEHAHSSRAHGYTSYG